MTAMVRSGLPMETFGEEGDEMVTYEQAGAQLLRWLDQPTPAPQIEADVARWPDEALEGLQFGLVMALADPVFGAGEQRDITVMIWAIGNEDAKRRGRQPTPFPEALARKPESVGEGAR